MNEPSAHATMFHFVKQPRYYASVDEIREPHLVATRWPEVRRARVEHGGIDGGNAPLRGPNPLGKLPGSVWNPATMTTGDQPMNTTPGRTLIIRGDAANLPLPDASVDLIVTSPPFFALRSYTDGGKHYRGQLGSEPTPQEYIQALITCTREWVRVLKPDGSLFVELGDKYSGAPSGPAGITSTLGVSKGEANHQTAMRYAQGLNASRGHKAEGQPKSLLGLPWRYALACIDELGLILRAEIVWNHVNGLPESVTDRVRRGHSTMFHLVKQPRYYASVDEIREPQAQPGRSNRSEGLSPRSVTARAEGIGKGTFAGTPLAWSNQNGRDYNPLGKLPGSVWNGPIWDIPSQPLRTPECRLVWDGRTIRWFPTWADGHAHMRALARDGWAWSQHQGRPSLRPEVDHFAAFPLEVPRRVILGWSPPGICVVCGEGRRPVMEKRYVKGQSGTSGFKKDGKEPLGRLNGTGMAGKPAMDVQATITGYACACTPYTDHPERRGKDFHNQATRATQGANDHNGGERYRRYVEELANPRGPVREYDQDWTPPPTRPALILDPFGGTGSTALQASTLGRDAISVDMSQDYSRLARWRTTDRPEVARAMGVKKPPPPPPANQSALF